MSKNMKKINDVVMFACNQGGHFSQMMALRSLFGNYNSVLVTDNILATKDNTPALKDIGIIEYAMSMAEKRVDSKNNRAGFAIRFNALSSYLKLFCDCIRIWEKYRPKVIITTGSNIAVALFLYGKIRGSKLIFIETRAKVYSKTLTGKIVGKVADKIFVQWPEMIAIYPNAEYCGTLV